MDISLQTFEPVLKAIAVAGLPTLESTLTELLSSTVLGPLGPLVSPEINRVWPAINRAMGLAPDSTPDQTATAITADPAAAHDKLADVQEQHAYLLQSAKARQDFELAVQAQQDALNAAAASSPSWFVAGPRPAIMWGFGALAMAYAGAPLFAWFVSVFGLRFGAPPDLDWHVWVGLFSLLGIGYGLRTYEKSAGIATVSIGTSPPATRRGGR